MASTADDSGPCTVQWVIYRHPRDNPSGWGVRRWEVPRDDPRPVPMEGYHGDTLDAVRSVVPPHAVCMGRDLTDDEAIFEVWA